MIIIDTFKIITFSVIIHLHNNAVLFNQEKRVDAVAFLYQNKENNVTVSMQHNI